MNLRSLLKAAVIVVLFTSSACTGPAGADGEKGADGKSGSNGQTARINVTPEPEGAICAMGGVRIDSGLDSDASGTLETSEVTGSQFVCDGSVGTNGTDGANGTNVIVTMVSEPAGTNCAAGGTLISAGPDANGDGALDAAEVSSTAYVCGGSNGMDGTDGAAGASGHDSLATTQNEPAGTNCPSGGIKLTTGLDGNDNGLLDSSEITSTAFVCNGANGTNGANGVNGHNSLVAIASEPAGANCASGGTRITSGVDANDNGTLDTAEVSATSFVCNGPGLSWVNVTSDTAIQTKSNVGYIANNPSSAVTFTLPASPVVGDIVRFKGSAAPGFVIAQNAGQSVNLSGLNAWSSLAGNAWSRVLHTANTWELSVASSADGQIVAALNSWTNNLNVSRDGGKTWMGGLFTIADPNLANVVVSPDGQTMFIRSFDGTRGFYVSTDAGATWAQKTSMTSVIAMAAYNDGVVAIGTVGGTVGVHRSTDIGTSWTHLAIPGEPAGACWTSIAASYDGNSIVTGGDGNGSCPLIPVFFSRDQGASWVASSTGGPPHNRNQQVSISPSGNNVVVTSLNSGIPVFVSSDGVAWTHSGAFQPMAPRAAVSSDGRRIALAGWGVANVYLSVNGGASWTTVPTAEVLTSITGSSDLSVLFNGTGRNTGGYVYKSASTLSTTHRTTIGTGGSVTAGANDALELQYLGSGSWGVLSGIGVELVIK